MIKTLASTNEIFYICDGCGTRLYSGTSHLGDANDGMEQEGWQQINFEMFDEVKDHRCLECLKEIESEKD